LGKREEVRGQWAAGAIKRHKWNIKYSVRYCHGQVWGVPIGYVDNEEAQLNREKKHGRRLGVEGVGNDQWMAGHETWTASTIEKMCGMGLLRYCGHCLMDAVSSNPLLSEKGPQGGRQNDENVSAARLHRIKSGKRGGQYQVQKPGRRRKAFASCPTSLSMMIG